MSRTLRHSLGRRLSLALAAVALAACGGDSTGPSSQATLRISNASSRTLVRIYFSACNDSDWGDDRLGNDETIAPGAQRSWTVAAGCYDVQAVSSAGESLEWYDEQFAAGGTRQLTAGEASARRAAFAMGGAAKER